MPQGPSSRRVIDDGKYTPPSISYIREAHELGKAHGATEGEHLIPEEIRKNALWLSAYRTGYSAGEQERLLESAARKVAK